MKKSHSGNVAIIVLVTVLVAGITSAVFLSQKNSQKQTSPSKRSTSLEDNSITAGSLSRYLEFNQEDYEKALASDKIVFLNFYANWCPICREEQPLVEEVFNELKTDQVVGFRVNYNDSDTNEAEKKLADRFGITYQHTKVILKDGKEVLKNGEPWDKERFEEEITNAAQ